MKTTTVYSMNNGISCFHPYIYRVVMLSQNTETIFMFSIVYVRCRITTPVQQCLLCNPNSLNIKSDHTEWSKQSTVSHLTSFSSQSRHLHPSSSALLNRFSAHCGDTNSARGTLSGTSGMSVSSISRTSTFAPLHSS